MKLPIYNRLINNGLFELFKERLFEIDWHEIKVYENPDEAYRFFLHKFLAISFFPKENIKVKSKDSQSPWITKGIKKSPKHKQRLYEKILKKRNLINELEYKTYKTLFEGIKKSSKKLHFSKIILKCEDSIKKTCEVIKESTGTEKFS